MLRLGSYRLYKVETSATGSAGYNIEQSILQIIYNIYCNCEYINSLGSQEVRLRRKRRAPLLSSMGRSNKPCGARGRWRAEDAAGAEPTWRRTDRDKVTRGIAELFKQQWTVEATPLRHLWESEPAAWPPNLRIGEMLNSTFCLPKPPCRDTEEEFWRYYPLNHAPPNIFKIGHGRTPSWTSGWTLQYHDTDMPTALHAVSCGELLLEDEAVQRPTAMDFDIAVRSSAVYPLHGLWQARIVLLVAVEKESPQKIYVMGLCIGRMTKERAEMASSDYDDWGHWNGARGRCPAEDAAGGRETAAAWAAGAGYRSQSLPGTRDGGSRSRPSVAAEWNEGDTSLAEPPWRRTDRDKVTRGIAELFKQQWTVEATPLRHLWESEPAAWPPNLRIGEMLNSTFCLPKPPCRDTEEEFWRYYPLNHAPPNIFKIGHGRTPSWTSGWTLQYHGTDMPTALHAVSCGELLLEDEAVQRPTTMDFDIAVRSSAVYPLHGLWQERVVLLVAVEKESPQKVYVMGLCIGRMTKEMAESYDFSGL